MRVFLAGACGAIGRRLVPLLLQAGHHVTGKTRSADNAKAAYAQNARIRIEGTRNLIAGAQRASVGRFIVQSIAFAYAPGGEPHSEADPLNVDDPMRAVTVRATADMEQQVLGEQGMEGIVLRYGLLYGPGTWHDIGVRKPALHVDAAAQAALLAVARGTAGIYNIADDEGLVSIDKARAELGFDPQFRL